MAKYLDDSGLAYLWSKLKAMLAGKQATLVSGTNIKTINNESVLGSGNITISGGGGTALTTQEIEDAVDAAFYVAEYTVTVSLTNPRSTAEFNECRIYTYESTTAPYHGDLIDTIMDPAGSITVSVPGSAMGIVVEPIGAAVWYSGTPTCTGGVSYVRNDSGYIIFEVTADGTAVIDGIDYDF